MNFAVSGMLWNRSLVMVDKETRSLWSHLLGEAMDGKLKGSRLEIIPATMVTWQAWRREHPKTTVVNLPRTARNYVKEFYRRPRDFVFGWLEDGQAYAAAFDVLIKTPVINLNRKRSPLVLTFDSSSTAANLFSSDVEGHTLQFVRISAGRMKDRQTESVWNIHTGEAVEGPLKGKRLVQRAGIVSYASAWKIFHPQSRSVRPAE